MIGVAAWRGARAGPRPWPSYLDPLLQFARALPPPVTLVPVFLVLFRIGTQMEVATIAFGTVWPILLNTIDGARPWTRCSWRRRGRSGCRPGSGWPG